MNKIKIFLGIAAIAVIAAFSFGCQTKLAPGGAYAPGFNTVITNVDSTVATNFTATAAPDIAFYLVDASFDEAYSLLDSAFEVEYKNRALLWSISPSIKQSLDAIRPTAWRAITDYTAARNAYKANPTAVGLTTLQTVMSRMQAVTSAATAATMNVTNLPAQ